VIRSPNSAVPIALAQAICFILKKILTRKFWPKGNPWRSSKSHQCNATKGREMATDPTDSRPWIIDTHVHLDILHHRFGPEVKWFWRHRCTLISWAFGLHIDTISGLKSYLSRQAQVISDLNRQSPWGCFFLAGVHPRNIPADLAPEKVADLLTPFLGHPLCLGLGEIGLETGTDQEKDIFQAQLELARSLKDTGIRVGVHTPRGNKKAMTDSILAILDHYMDLYPAVVVDHCNADTLAKVLDRGLWAGVTLSPSKTAVEALPGLLEKYSRALSRLMCNTDSMEEMYQDLINATQNPLLSDGVKQKITRSNAAHFWNLKINACGIVERNYML